VLTAAKTAVCPVPLRVLLVGKKEEDFFLIREILERNGKGLAAELDHAHSLDEAKFMLKERDYGLVLFEYDSENASAAKLLSLCSRKMRMRKRSRKSLAREFGTA